jgi:CRISPR-associated endonuclease/helicase Cas3
LVTDEILAKSSVPDTDARARRRANELSGYPKGARHELLSLAMAIDPNGPLGAANDPVLVRHLIASHHGFGRYRFEPSTDLEPEVAAFRVGEHELSSSTDHLLHDLGSGVSDNFWQMVRRYGWFGLTWLESILRLADHVRSRAEQQGTVDGGDKADEVTP